ncbi:MAG TPA: ABATE domain-containing protein [Candidatus Udaeobacter sp.]|nr:ABATE domain-containing protein [Candidatus Udaeobacter sp.]
MPVASKVPDEWRDGFLFVGNHLALDFLNTRPILAEGPKELLPDVDALVRWLVASGVLTPQKGKTLAEKWQAMPEASVFLRALLKFRERLRAVVIRQEARLSVSNEFIAETNSLLKHHPSVIALQQKGKKLELEAASEPEKPNDVWAPIAIAVAELLSGVSPGRLRKCEACIVHFLDTSKKGSRRWCSMKICGNKIKVAAYQKRKRAAGKKMRRGR